jgi:hypothetical protein
VILKEASSKRGFFFYQKTGDRIKKPVIVIDIVGINGCGHIRTRSMDQVVSRNFRTFMKGNRKWRFGHPVAVISLWSLTWIPGNL